MKLLKPYFWDSKNLIFIPLCLLLYPVSLMGQLLILLKKVLNKNELNMKIPVVCIGNIYVGGTGKTPLALEVYKIFKKKGLYPVIIKKLHSNQEDEINLIKSKTKNLIVSKERRDGVSLAKKKKYDCVILDDGLQDYSIKKHLKIVCFGNQLDGNGWTLPSGPLREPFKSIKGSHIIVVNTPMGKPIKRYDYKIKKTDPKIKVFYSKYQPDLKLIKKFKNRKILTFAGIGNPVNFFSLLKKYGLNLKKQIRFPDHYNYSKEELINIIKDADNNNLDIITTEKDYYRIKKFGLKKIRFIPVSVKINKEKKFITEIMKLKNENI